MRRLTLIVADPDPDRLRTGLELAAAWAALDRPARLFLQGQAAGLLRAPLSASSDEAYAQAGLPTLAALLDEVLALGAQCIACQSGLALSGIAAGEMPDGVAIGGLVSLLGDAADDQLLLV